jgi:excinuclease ABC subunit A
MENKAFTFVSIGYVETKDNRKIIRIKEEYKKGLTCIEQFTHIHVFIWCDRKYTTGDLGCFASPGAYRPVPIVSKICKVSGVDHRTGTITIEGTFNSGPFIVIDIKPYMPVSDLIRSAHGPETNKNDIAIPEEIKSMENDNGYKSRPIGFIRKERSSTFIEIDQDYKKEMRGLNSYSHMRVLWFFHRFDKPRYRNIMEVNPPYEAPVTGVFASRSPVRPNPIAVTNVKIKDIDFGSGTITISSIDAFNNTPVLDITPYLPWVEIVQPTGGPDWQAHWPDSNTETEDRDVTNIELKEADIETIISANFTGLVPMGDTADKSPVEISEDPDKIIIAGARQNNLKNINVNIPRGRLTVITGLSGSGKSSLAFDTLYAEGQRRYMQSISSSSRQAAAILEKPDFDYIENLMPAIAIEQKSISRNPRSTVGTISDVYNYLRLLFTKLGTRHCIDCGRAIRPISSGELARQITSISQDAEIKLYSGKEVEEARLISGFQIDKAPPPERLYHLVVEGYKNGSGYLTLLLDNSEVIKVSEKEACPYCDNLLFPLHPSVFSFNSPEGMCLECSGLGTKRDIDVTRLVDPEKSLLDGGSVFLGNLRKHREKPNANWMRGGILALAQALNVDLETPWKELPDDFKEKALYGTGEEKYSFTYNSAKTGRAGTITRPVEGMVSILRRLLSNANSRNDGHEHLHHFINEQPCDVCRGERLAPTGRLVTLGGKRFPEAASLTINDLYNWLKSLPALLRESGNIAEQIFGETERQLCAMMDLGLHYLTLDRSITTLSGGEAQRVKLSTQMGCGLSGLLYVLDEPSIGLHSRDHSKIINSMKSLRDLGNTVVVVEHDLATMRQADYIIDLGPGAGYNGGEVVASGTPDEIANDKGSVTADFISGRTIVNRISAVREGNGRTLGITGARLHNLQSISVNIPLGCITCVTGVSGSGKSSLITQTLVPALKQKLHGAEDVYGPFDNLIGLENIDKIIRVDQTPIGRSPRSNPATYIGLFDEIRSVFAGTEGAKRRNFKANRFSFNDKKGQCSECEGHGRKKIEMVFLPDVWVTCRECKGSRYNKETLEVTYKDKNIAQILDMDVGEAHDFFKDHGKIGAYLQILIDVGLSYLKLGQSALSFSGGEAQRIKLANELRKPDTGKTLFVLDEPTSGLHPRDIQHLLGVLNKLADLGNTLIIIEHNLDIIRNADWVIDLGPEGGSDGGRVIAEGTPEDISRVPDSYTGQALFADGQIGRI